MSTLTAIFPTQEAAARALVALTKARFSRDEISIVVSRDVVHGQKLAIVEESKAAEGSAIGGALGGMLGAIAASIAAAGAIALPGIGVIAAGGIVAALAGAGAGGIAGGIVGALVGAGIPEHEAVMIQDAVVNGQILLVLHADDGRDEFAREILRASGASEVKAA